MSRLLYLLTLFSTLFLAVRRRNHGKGHSYWDGDTKLDGVTTLLSEGLAKPALINWAANTTTDYAIDHWEELSHDSISDRVKKLRKARFIQRDEAARRGTEVHKLAESLLQGHEVEVPDELAGHVESYVRFLDQWQPKPVLVETVVASRKWQYAGQLDMVIEITMPDGRVFIADIKTSRSGIFPETGYQLAAYANAEVYLDENGEEQPMSALGIDGALGIWVRADGYDVFQVDISQTTFNTFLHIAHVARQTRDNKDLVGQALTVPGSIA